MLWRDGKLERDSSRHSEQWGWSNDGRIWRDAHEPFIDASGRAQKAALAQETVPPNSYGRITPRSSARRGCRLRRTCEIASDHCLGLDDGLAAEHDVLGSDEDGLSRNLVAGILTKTGHVRRIRIQTLARLRGDVPSRCTLPSPASST